MNYKNVMKQYGLGPNGGILTACNLFATRFDQARRGAGPRASPPCAPRCARSALTSDSKPLQHPTASYPPSQVIALCEKARDPPLEYIVADTPGQIEIFTWSASGQLVTELFASGFPTMVAYVMDTPRCARD